MVAFPADDLVTLKSVRKVAPPEGMLAGLATAQPVELLSVWLPGTGVNAAVPFAFLRLPVRANLNVDPAGQLVPAGGWVNEKMVEPVNDPDPLKLLVPISRKSRVSPSLG